MQIFPSNVLENGREVLVYLPLRSDTFLFTGRRSCCCGLGFACSFVRNIQECGWDFIVLKITSVSVCSELQVRLCFAALRFFMIALALFLLSLFKEGLVAGLGIFCFSFSFSSYSCFQSWQSLCSIPVFLDRTVCVSLKSLYWICFSIVVWYLKSGLYQWYLHVLLGHKCSTLCHWTQASAVEVNVVFV